MSEEEKNQKKGKNKIRTRGMRRKGEEKPRMRSKGMWRCRGVEDYECEKIDEGIKTRHVLHCTYVSVPVQGEHAGTSCTCQTV
jgi:hypothetical protein